MDQLDRHLRAETTAMQAAKGPRGFGLSRRRRGGVGLGLLALVALVLAMLVSGGSSSDVPGLCAELEVACAGGPECEPAELEQARLIIESRVLTTGLTGPAVRSYVPDRIEVALPFVELGSEWADSVLDLISAVGFVELLPVPPELADEPLLDRELPAIMRDIEPILDGTGVVSARVDEDTFTSEPIVELWLDEVAAAALDAHARDHFGERFVIVLDGVVKSAPFINATRYDGQVLVGGGFSLEVAHDLVTLLHFGVLPLDVHEVVVRDCGGAPVEGAER